MMKQHNIYKTGMEAILIISIIMASFFIGNKGKEELKDSSSSTPTITIVVKVDTIPKNLPVKMDSIIKKLPLEERQRAIEDIMHILNIWNRNKVKDFQDI